MGIESGITFGSFLENLDRRKDERDGKKRDYDNKDGKRFDRNDRNDKRDQKWDRNKSYRKDDRRDDNRRDDNRFDNTYDRVVATFIEKKKNPIDPIEDFAKKLLDAKFREKLLNLSKRDGDVHHNAVLGAVVHDIISNPKYKIDGEIYDECSEIIDELLNERAKEIRKGIKEKHRPPKDIAVYAALAVPSPTIVTDQNIFHFTQFLNYNIYKGVVGMEGDDEDMKRFSANEKGMKALYAETFGEDMLPKCAIACLLEKKELFNNMTAQSQKDVWSVITDFALDILNDLETDRIEELIKAYTKQRFHDYDDKVGFRRISLMNIDAEDYKKLFRVVRSLARDTSFEKYLK